MHQDKLLGCENLLGNKPASDSKSVDCMSTVSQCELDIYAFSLLRLTVLTASALTAETVFEMSLYFLLEKTTH